MEANMVDMAWWQTFFFLMLAVMLVLKLLTGSTLPAEAVGIPLLLFVGTLFIGSQSAG
jgi:hypothetical protein